MTEDRSSGTLRDAGRMSAWFGIVLLVLWLVFLGGSWVGIYSVSLRVVSVLLAGLAIAIWLIVARRLPDWRPRTALWPAFAAALAAFTIGELTSRQPRWGADYLAYAVILAALYLLLVRLMAQRLFREQILALAVVLCLIVGLVYVAVVGRDWLDWWNLIGRIARPPLRPDFEGLTWRNPSAVMTIALLLLAPAAAHLGFGSWGRRIAVAGLMVLTLAVTVLTGSRAGWLGLAIGVAVTGGAWLLFTEHRALVRAALRAPAVRIAIVALGVGGVAAAVVFAPGFLSRAGAGGEDLRATYYVVALRLFASSPLVGTGPGTWVGLRAGMTLAGEPDYYIPHAHDLYLQTLAEFGLLGALAGIVVLGCLGWLIRDAIRDPDPVRRRFGWATLFATVYFGGHQLLDFYPNMPAALFAYAIPIAWLDATARRPISEGLERRVGEAIARLQPVPAIAAILTLVVAAGWLARSEAAALEMDTGSQLANAGDWAGALPHFRSAADQDPDLPPYQLALGIAAANTDDSRTAEIALARAATADDLPAAWLDLAAVRLRLGNTAGVRAALGRALRLGNQQPAVNVGVAWLDVRLGDTVSAQQALTAAIKILPGVAGASLEGTPPELAALWPAAIDRAIAEAAPESGFDAAVSAGQLERATHLAASVPDPSTRALFGLVLRAWRGDTGALAGLRQLAAARPLDLVTVGWTARAFAHADDTATADDYRRWADHVEGAAAAGGHDIAIARSAGEQSYAGVLSEFYGHYTYRRPTPWDQLVGILPHLVYR